MAVLIQLSTRMNAKILIIFSFLFIATCSSIVVPCIFDFTPSHGYTCIVFNFTNNSTFDHVTEIDGVNQTLSEISVVRIVMHKLDVSYLPGNLTQLFPHLRTIQVKSCGLKKLTRSTELNRLRRLYLGFNEITEIPVVYFWNFCKLRVLSLFGNQISEIPKMAFRDLKSLEKLSLSQNRLTSLHPYLFECTEMLAQIDLDGNQFMRIPSSLFASNTNLMRLSVRHNQIVEIGNDFLNNHNKLKYVSFVGNQCINQNFQKSKNSNSIKLQSFLELFERDCSPPTTTTTTTPKPTTLPPRKKPPHEPQKIFFYENCEWHAPPNHRYF